jgi:hypothetical protein
MNRSATQWRSRGTRACTEAAPCPNNAGPVIAMQDTQYHQQHGAAQALTLDILVNISKCVQEELLHEAHLFVSALLLVAGIISSAMFFLCASQHVAAVQSYHATGLHSIFAQSCKLRASATNGMHTYMHHLSAACNPVVVLPSGSVQRTAARHDLMCFRYGIVQQKFGSAPLYEVLMACVSAAGLVQLSASVPLPELHVWVHSACK